LQIYLPVDKIEVVLRGDVIITSKFLREQQTVFAYRLVNKDHMSNHLEKKTYFQDGF